MLRDIEPGDLVILKGSPTAIVFAWPVDAMTIDIWVGDTRTTWPIEPNDIRIDITMLWLVIAVSEGWLLLYDGTQLCYQFPRNFAVVEAAEH